MAKLYNATLRCLEPASISLPAGCGSRLDPHGTIWKPDECSCLMEGAARGRPTRPGWLAWKVGDDDTPFYMATTLYVAPSHHLTAGRVITDATIVGWQSDPPALYITDHSGESDRLLRILLPDGEPIPLLTGAAPSHPSIAATAETIFIAGLVDERVLLQVTDLEGAPLAALFISDKAPPPYKDNLHPWLRSVEPLGPNRVVFITSHRHGHVNLIWLWELAGPHPR